MVVKTQLTSPVADKAQHGHDGVAADQPPARLPDLRQGRRVPAAEPGDVQRRAAESRFHEIKRTYEKPMAISSEVLLDRERCVLCARCTRFSLADRR